MVEAIAQVRQDIGKNTSTLHLVPGYLGTFHQDQVKTMPAFAVTQLLSHFKIYMGGLIETLSSPFFFRYGILAIHPPSRTLNRPKGLSFDHTLGD